MKKLYLLLLTVFSLAAANAQVQFGVKAGANFSTLTGDVSGTKIKVGFNGGAFVALPLFSQFSLQPEVMFSGQGAKESGGSSATLNDNYLNIPVLFKYNNPSGFFAETGPQVGFLMSAKFKESGQPDVDLKDEFNSTDFSWAIGVGYLIKSVNVGIDGRYNLGLSNTLKNSNGSAKNSVFQVGVFYLFGGGSE